VPLDLTKAPPGIAEYAEGLRNMTNAQLFERITAWPDRDSTQFTDPQLVESILWTLRCEIEELRLRLASWLATEPAVLPAYSGPSPGCPKCGAGIVSVEKKGAVKAAVRTSYHAEPEPDFSCWMRLEERREHLHQLCKACGYEWIEACEQ
jgi:predicted RNA-binding Zn-ribbon protein involved in translation (DUF1610 family)